MKHRPRRHLFAFRFTVAVATIATALAPANVLAQEAPATPRAEELFLRGKALLAKGDYMRACPLLATSFDLDPGTGVLLALAICHEGEGKLASASAEYKQTAERAKQEGRADRERVARERARALEPRLSTLTVVPPPDARDAPDFVIHRSGVVLDENEWGNPVALDGGDYVIEAGAPGKKPWRTHVTLAASGGRETVTVPPLENSLPGGSAALETAQSGSTSPTGGAPGSKPVRKRRTDATNAAGGPSTLQLVGLGAMGAGAVGLGVGTFYALRAVDRNDDSNRNGCEGDICEGQGKSDRLAARSAGNTATIAFAVGATLALGGTTALLFGGSVASSEPTRATKAVVTVERGGATLTLRGSLK